MSLVLTRIDVLKKNWPDKSFYTQSWVYQGIMCWYGQQNKFDQLAFGDDLNSLVICDRQQNQPFDDRFKYQGFVLDGPAHHDWLDKVRDCIWVGGSDHFLTLDHGNISLGFDYWDSRIFRDFSAPVYGYEINQQGVDLAQYDVAIASGSARAHRAEFLTLLDQRKKDLTIVTDDNQSHLETDLRFGKLGLEIYFNKFNIHKFQPYKYYESFFDPDLYSSLDHLPHKLMYQLARVNVVLETSIKNSNYPWMTEKTYKVLAQHRPFVILGETNVLHKLKQKGFKTFDQFCDESYDQETNLTDRCKKIIKAVHELVEACKKHPADIDKICQHNQKVFFDQQRHADQLARFGKLCIDTFNL